MMRMTAEQKQCDHYNWEIGISEFVLIGRVGRKNNAGVHDAGMRCVKCGLEISWRDLSLLLKKCMGAK